ncbi:ABC transporter permease [Sulfuricurvum sp.]|uniref:ABC transporter permease n=1 Tax=Sulfuricurvum sp. TaxID=2025608 RepID=UPI0019BBD0F2|nr:ABC transporter permease [Sulfuricurvum sp.]MBD3798310.1 ABC transporter permease [Campylobacterota bacterium]MBD3805653.1 ABC transporter permease [Sulfuricurvum sp.]
MNIVPFLVKRFLRFDKEQPFIFLSALLAFSGIALGVMVLIIAMALMNGFDNEFKKKLTVMNYPLTIQPKFFGTVDTALVENLRVKFPDLAFSPYVTSAVLARSSDQMEGGYLFGVDFAQEAKVNAVLAEGLKNGIPEGFEVMIGQTLKEEFMLQDGEKLTYIFTQMEPGGMVLAPKMKRFAMVTTFNSGLSAYDKGFSYTSIDAMQRILGIPKNLYDGIHIHSPNPEADIHRIAAVLPDTVSIRGWWEDNSNFFAALKMEKMSLFIVLMLIILIAAINIISSLLMTVMNRRSEIALLISLGASKTEVKKIFLILGVVIGVLGITTGAILGFLGMWILGTFEIISLPTDVYPTSTLPLDLSVIDFFSIIIGAFVIVLLSAWYPAKKASEVDVLTVLRNE